MAFFFIKRPVFAWVLAIFIVFAGLLSLWRLPLEQYPDIAPPRISIAASYNGAAANTVNDSVVQVIEQQLKGLDRLMYMSSSSDSSGRARTTLTFTPGTDIDVAQVQVQNVLQQALSRLPEAVQSQGVRVTKSGQDSLVTWMFTSDDARVSKVEIGDYLSSNVIDVLGRIDGVADIELYGSPYAMRIWLNPHQLEQYQLMPADITAALNAQNTQVSAGQLGQLPAVDEQMLNVPIQARGKLQTVQQFENVILKSRPNGAVVLLKDVARVELAAESANVQTKLNGKQTGAALGIILADNANALDVADAVAAKIRELEPNFPFGLKASTMQDSTPFVKASVNEVLKTLLEAIVLVVIVMYVFLQSGRATLIPAVAVPVVLMGTLAVMSLLGYSINTLTMFALVLAIGLLVDDAIVVVENVERVMHEQGVDAQTATQTSMREISSALIGVGMTLAAVFVPMAFFPGSTGVIYRQFAVTLIAAMVFSVVVALSLTPAMCVQILKTKNQCPPRVGLMGRFLAWFNRGFDSLAQRYHHSVFKLLRRSRLMLAAFGLLVLGSGLLFYLLPTSFLPEEDQGFLSVSVTMPAGATDARLQRTVAVVNDYFLQQPEVAAVNAITGLGGNQGMARLIVRLQPWAQRPERHQSAAALAERASAVMRQRNDARIFVSLPPLVRGLGSDNGVNLMLKDINGVGYPQLVVAKDELIRMSNASGVLRNARTSNQDDRMQLKVVFDDRKAAAQHINIQDLNRLLSDALGGSYVNDFILNGRIKRVYIQGDAPYRMQPENIGEWTVRNAVGQMVPLASIARIEWEMAPPQLLRFNGSPAMEIVANTAPGVSSGDAMRQLESMVSKLNPGIGFEWAGVSLEEQKAGAQAPLLYVLSIVFVFLCLAALYESWSIPLAVILAAVLGIGGALLTTFVRGLNNDVFFQVGLLTTVGLAAKNAILIVEFAVQLQQRGHGLWQAAADAARLRLRPIVMTSLAFGFGVLPLAISSGPGAASRIAIGTAVLGGTVLSTILGLVFVPLFFVWIRGLIKRPVNNEHPQSQ